MQPGAVVVCSHGVSECAKTVQDGPGPGPAYSLGSSELEWLPAASCQLQHGYYGHLPLSAFESALVGWREEEWQSLSVAGAKR